MHPFDGCLQRSSKTKGLSLKVIHVGSAWQLRGVQVGSKLTEPSVRVPKRGEGSVPSSGTSNAISFVIATNSVLEWQWNVQYALAQVSSIPGLLDTTNWWDLGTTSQTTVAEACIARDGTNYCFAEWRLDGSRCPDATNIALNPVTGILMTTSRVATAVYFAETTDTDGDGLADWWEYFYWGNTDYSAGDDPDNDSHTNGVEFLDRSNPRDAASQPMPPNIQHTPLTDPQMGPPPWTVQAVVTDNYTVASVTLFWGRVGYPPVTTAMVALAGGDVFGAEIPAPADSGDTFVYLIEARDPMGTTVQHGLHMFEVAYPDVLVLPTNDFTAILRPDGKTNFTFALTNAGDAPLTWQLDPVWIEDVEQGTNGWSLGPGNFAWQIGANRSWSPTHAWYATMDTGPLYFQAGHIRLDTPPLPLGSSAVLTFRHWINSELDTNPLWPGYAYDAGVVEISTDNGLTFEHINPEGGYPDVLHAWLDNETEPWPMDTPCFAGTGGWEEVAFDLAAYEGEEVIIRFHYGGDDNTDREGWYIDDITITAAPSSNEWFSTAPPNGVVAAGAATNIAVGLNATNMATGDRRAIRRLVSNDPFEPTVLLRFAMLVRSPPEVAIPYAAQFSTNGEGRAVISNRVYDVDGDPCDLSVEYSTDGVNWTNAAISDAGAAFGSVYVTNDSAMQVLDVQTTQGNGGVSNDVAAVWATTNMPAVPGLATNTRVRVRAWDGIFWSAMTTSGVFMVDNQAPSTPPSLNVVGHTIETWSTNPAVDVHWDSASDGAGGGVAGYGLLIGGDPAQHAGSMTTTGLSAWAAAPRDGTDLWVTVCAFDVYGNHGPVADAGPYWIDTTAPSPSNVLVQFAVCPYGDYVFGSVVTCSWSGFTEEMSGISNYFVRFADYGGTTNGLTTVDLTATLTEATLDATNVVYVWARDNAGLIGQAIGAGILVLNPANDFDLDGMDGAAEAVAGTDASDPQSVLAINWPSAGSMQGTNMVVVEWSTEPGRFYSLFRAPRLTNQWEAVAAVSNRPGSGAMMGYTDVVDDVEMRFYRVEAKYP